jgi:hypothetical protein
MTYHPESILQSVASLLYCGDLDLLRDDMYRTNSSEKAVMERWVSYNRALTVVKDILYEFL